MTPKKRNKKSRSKKRCRSKTKKRDGDDHSKKIELKQELLISRLKKIIKNVNEMEKKIKKYSSPKKYKERKILINKRLKSPGKSKVKFDVSMITPNYNVVNTSKYNYLGSNNHNMNSNQQGYNQQPSDYQPFMGEGGGGGGGSGGGGSGSPYIATNTVLKQNPGNNKTSSYVEEDKKKLATGKESPISDRHVFHLNKNPIMSKLSPNRALYKGPYPDQNTVTDPINDDNKSNYSPQVSEANKHVATPSQAPTHLSTGTSVLSATSTETQNEYTPSSKTKPRSPTSDEIRDQLTPPPSTLPSTNNRLRNTRSISRINPENQNNLSVIGESAETVINSPQSTNET